MSVGYTPAGLCWIGFAPGYDCAEGIRRLRAHWPAADFADCAVPSYDKVLQGKDTVLDLHGTDFQLRVWDALLAIAPGAVLTYRQVACAIGSPNASRAVGGAVGANPISILVPCHRVVPSFGGVGHYGWGSDLKRRLLDSEGAAALCR